MGQTKGRTTIKFIKLYSVVHTHVLGNDDIIIKQKIFFSVLAGITWTRNLCNLLSNSPQLCADVIIARQYIIEGTCPINCSNIWPV